MENLSISLMENNIRFLNKASDILPRCSATTVLQSYYLQKCRIIASGSTVTLGKDFTKSTTRCPRCKILFKDGPTSNTIQPSNKSTRCLRRLARGNPKTKFQEKYFKKLKKSGTLDTHNTLVITCGVCKEVVKEVLVKQGNNAEDKVPISKMDKKKKKKKKDQFAGLNVQAVASINTSLTPSKLPTVINEKTEALINKKKTSVITPNQNINTTNSIGNSKNKNKKNKKQQMTPVLSQCQIKAQKRNNDKKLNNLKNILLKSDKHSNPVNSLKSFLSKI